MRCKIQCVSISVFFLFIPHWIRFRLISTECLYWTKFRSYDLNVLFFSLYQFYCSHKSFFMNRKSNKYVTLPNVFIMSSVAFHLFFCNFLSNWHNNCRLFFFCVQSKCCEMPPNQIVLCYYVKTCAKKKFSRNHWYAKRCILLCKLSFFSTNVGFTNDLLQIAYRIFYIWFFNEGSVLNGPWWLLLSFWIFFFRNVIWKIIAANNFKNVHFFEINCNFIKFDLKFLWIIRVKKNKTYCY